VLIVFSLRRELLKLILVDEPLPEVVLSHELTATEFTDYCAAEGVHCQHTSPYSPQQNGAIERRNGTVVATARSMLKAKGLPRWFWGQAVNAVVYVLNRCPMKSVDRMTLFDAWHGRKPAMRHLRMFGCKMIFVCYKSGSKAYCAYDPITKHVHVTRDVAFDGQAQWDWGSGGDNGKPFGGNDVITVEYTTTGPVSPMEDGADETPTEESPLLTGASDAEVDDDVNNENLDADHDDDTPLCFHSMSDILTTPRLEEGDEGGDGLH
jgi:hypothetical protein